MFKTNLTQRNRTWKPVLESLEDRQLMAAHVFQVGNPSIGYYLRIEGTQLRDEVVVTDLVDGGVKLRLTPGDTGVPKNYEIHNQKPAWIRFEGFGGSNSFLNFTNTPAIVITGSGNDFIQGGSDRDLIMAGGGENEIYGGAGDDVIVGGNERDIIYAEAGNDSVWGMGGSDVIDGGTGNDYLDGSTGDDWLIGSSGADILIGWTGDDWLFGGLDNDHLFGNNGDDHLYGDAGDDRLFGGFGHDWIHGGAQNDYLSGGYDLSLDELNGDGGINIAEFYVQLNNYEQDSFLEQMSDSILHVGSFGLIDMPPFGVTNATLPLQTDNVSNCTRNMEILPQYGKDPEDILYAKDIRSVVEKSQSWSDYVIGRARNANLQGPGTELLPTRRTFTTSTDPMLQYHSFSGSTDREFSATTHTLNMEITVELEGTPAWMDDLENISMNLEDLLLADLLNEDYDTETHELLLSIQDQSGLGSWIMNLETETHEFLDEDGTFSGPIDYDFNFDDNALFHTLLLSQQNELSTTTRPLFW